MPTYGLTSAGFLRKTLLNILDDVNAAEQAAFGVGIKNTDPAFALTQLNTILMTPVAEAWEVLEAVNKADDPDNAEGAALDAVCALTGTTRLAPKQSTVTIACTGTPGTVLASGRVVSVSGAGDKFQTTAGGTITAVSAWAATTAYSAGARTTAGSKVYEATIGGTSASTAPSGTGTFVDGTVTWQYVGDGTAAVDVAAVSQEYDAVQAVAGALTVIETPVGGWSSARNMLDATPGQANESDPALRVRRLNELGGSGSKTADAIRSAVLKVTDVIACDVFANPTDFVDADGVPAHAIEVLVRGGDDQAIRDAIFSKVDPSTYTHGSVVGTSNDSKGTAWTVRFSRPTQVLIYVDVTVTKIAAKYPANGDALIKSAIVAVGDQFASGYDVFANALIPAVFSVVGVLNVTSIFVDDAPSPGAATTPITSRQLAVFDTSRITVTTSNGTP